MRTIKYTLFLAILLFCVGVVGQGLAQAAKTIAIGDVDTGYSMMSGKKAYDVKETIQLLLKKDLEKIGKGQYNVMITSPAVITEGQEATEGKMPMLPQGKQPSQADMAKYMAEMQQWQKVMTGQVKVHKPVAADAFVELSVSSGQSGMDTGGAVGTISQFTGVSSSVADVSTKSTKVNLVCTLRNPATGTLIDRYTAKASKVRFRNIGGVTSYDYGDDTMTYERLFKSAVKKCAKWVSQKVQ